MGKALIIAEKPSVASDIAKVLKVKKSGDFFENDDYVISSAVGHLVGLAMPQEIDKKLGFWTLKSLPIIPDEFPLKVIPNTKTKFTELKKLLKRKDVDGVINACDAGREGELIFAYIYDLAGCKKPVKRLWMQSMTKDSILGAFSNLREESAVAPLRDAARCRSEADWLIGINGTRAVTKRTCGKGNVATVGRVQTPTLALVCEREELIRNFQSRDYWKIESTFQIKEGAYTGFYQRPDFKSSDDKDNKIDRVFDKAEAERLFNELTSLKGQNATVTDKAKRSKSAAPLLYDLTTLQREANRRFGYSATRTLQLAQALYEKHKVLTYPRTDSRALPEDYIGTCHNVLQKLDAEFSSCAGKVLVNNWLRPNKRIFNNAKISDHFAIIPTGEVKKSLSQSEQNIYDMVTMRFISVFYPAAEYDVTTRISEIGGHVFKTEGKVLAVPGWLEVYGKDNKEEASLPALTPADGSPALAALLETTAECLQTKPPARYSEATLLSAMENAGKMVEDDELAEAMKGKGLGTPATRASIIEHLCNEQYLIRQERSMIPTAKAEQLIQFLHAVGAEFLAQAELTGEWEFKLAEIEKGKLGRKEFMDGIKDVTRDTIDKIKNWEDVGTVCEGLVSNTDGQPMLEKTRMYTSQDGVLTVYKNIGGRQLSLEEAKELVTKRKIGPLDGFVSKAGRPYSAILYINDENKVKFEFPEREGEQAGPDPMDAKMLSYLEGVEWAEPEKRGKRVYDDSAFYKSLKQQSERRALSVAQRNALNKIIEKYSEQIPNYADLAVEFGLATEESKKAEAAKISAIIGRLETVTEWDAPSGKGRAKKDDKALVESFKSQFEKKGTLSPKQVAAMEKMAEKYSV